MDITLVVPIRNEEDSLPSLVSSIESQIRPPCRVVLVDGGSTDGTLPYARALASANPRYALIEAGKATPGRGRNLGIEASDGWVALTDAGVELAPDWLLNLAAAAKIHPTARIVYGSYEPTVESLFQQCAVLAYVAPLQQRDGVWMRGPSTASLLIHKDLWLEVGGFPDQRAAEDLVFFERVAAVDAPSAWAPTAVVRWSIQPDLRSTFQRFLSYSRHNALAGRQWDWHYGIARHYLLAVPFLGLAALHNWWWVTVPTLGFVIRGVRSMRRRRLTRDQAQTLNPLLLLGVLLILGAIDAATFLGWWQATRVRMAIDGARLR